MSRMVQCVLLKKEAPGLDKPPYPGELGKRIFENVSKEAWQQWMRHQVMLINEYRLTPIEPAHRKRLEFEMERFFFGDGSRSQRSTCLPDELRAKAWHTSHRNVCRTKTRTLRARIASSVLKTAAN